MNIKMYVQQVGPLQSAAILCLTVCRGKNSPLADNCYEFSPHPFIKIHLITPEDKDTHAAWVKMNRKKGVKQ